MAVLDPTRAPVLEPCGERHFIYAPAEEAARAIASALERQGWETAVHAGGDVWLVVASCLRVMTAPLAREVRTHLVALASQHGAEYDDWESATA